MSGRHQTGSRSLKEGTIRQLCRDRNQSAAEQLGAERARPRVGNPDYLVLRARLGNFQRLLQRLPGDLAVLDVGGRIQPYRALLGRRVKYYVAIDPRLHGLVDVVGVGEQLPFAKARFGLVLCTQVLSYASNPFRIIAEIHRVLRPGSYLFLSAPAFFPRHPEERWRFLPDGLRLLLRHFSHVEILPEGNSVIGGLRTMNVLLDVDSRHWLIARTMRSTLVPALNGIGLLFERISQADERLTANYSVLARR